ncbi:hypothetical protein BCR39DRAFT_511764 [Naematelia encephala]|uniref:Chromosome transmission fidelity protein 8 n=1 Tax=Naematelia encephala TaxID=71784 RepID=A0A1Y2BM35_9TREE|nr:hypothetical protein BCR39DRAFT_511764 [Naematelia encephala]
MRIHLSLDPNHFNPSGQSSSSSSSSPLIKLGGDLVILELQGELSYEGDDRSGGVVGVIGLDRPDHPTLHLGPHHLLHGKISVLPKPYAVIRRAVGDPNALISIGGTALEGDAEEEEEEDEEGEKDRNISSSTGKKKRKRVETGNTKDKEEQQDEDEDEDEGPLFAPNPDIFDIPTTPQNQRHPNSSSPILPPSSIKDYSSELGYSSPARIDQEDEDEDEEKEEQKDEENRKRARRKERKQAQDGKERTRHYEVVGIVRKKVVFALRPEPIVTATILPD